MIKLITPQYNTYNLSKSINKPATIHTNLNQSGDCYIKSSTPQFLGKIRIHGSQKWLYLNKLIENNPKRLIIDNEKCILGKIIPEFRETFNRKQNPTHDFTVGEHTVKVFENLLNMPEFKEIPKGERNLSLITSIFHDIDKRGAKISLKDKIEINIQKLIQIGFCKGHGYNDPYIYMNQLIKKGIEEQITHDPNHPKRSAILTAKILKTMKVDSKTADRICLLVKYHMELGNLTVMKLKKLPEIEYQKKLLSFAKSIKNQADIKILEILTKADMMAVKKDPSAFVSPETFKTLKNVVKEINSINSFK